MSTLRQAIVVLLKDQDLSAREISQVIGIREKEVYEHLAHIARSAAVKGKFKVQPAVCRDCGFEFKKRDRLTPPGRCFQCRSESIIPPRFRIKEV
jgi:predicted Zn-ribbon and HTH transcriptional regulator